MEHQQAGPKTSRDGVRTTWSAATPSGQTDLRNAAVTSEGGTTSWRS